MNEFKSMKEIDRELIKVRQLFDVLRSDINSDDYSIVLLFIYLRSEGIISEQLLNSSDIKSELNKLISNLNGKNDSDALHEIVSIFRNSIELLNEKTLVNLIEVLISIDHDSLIKNLADVFDDTLQKLAFSQGIRGGEFIQPKELTKFINAYIGNIDGLKIYNPFAGVASFIKDYSGAESIYAQELNKKTWAIGQLRLLAHKVSANYCCEDSIEYWQNQTKFDLIVANPPFDLTLDRSYWENYPKTRTAEDYLVKMSIDSLSNTGKLLAVLPNRLLFSNRRSEEGLRKELINNDLIDTIISFPGGILYHTGIPFFVLVLNKAKVHPGKIRLIDATSFIFKTNFRENIIESEKLITAIKGNESSEFIRLIDYDEIAKNKFNLNVPRYFLNEVEGVKLGDLLTYLPGESKDLPENGKLIRVRDLKVDPLDFRLNINEIETTPISRSNIQKIEYSCLLLTIRGYTLMPTFFEYEYEPIYKSIDILSFRVNKEKVDIAYLINELNADYVRKQIEAFKGSSMHFINRDDLLEIKVKLPSLEEQRAKVAGLKEISEKIKQLQSERNALAHGVSTKVFNEFASLKHTLGRPRQNILCWSKNFSKFFVGKKEAITALNDEFKTLFNLGIIEAIAEINRDIKFISDILEKGENGLVLSDYEKEIIPLTEINNIINTLSNNDFKFSIKKQLLKVDEMKTRGILINKILFKTLLDNLLTNANKYGFNDNNKGNYVMIELSEIDNQLILDVRNNGFPFPKNFDREKFITKYSTADTSNGFGLGGYDINRIATYFENENWDLILNTDPIYPVIFRFSFPIKLLK